MFYVCVCGCCVGRSCVVGSSNASSITQSARWSRLRSSFFFVCVEAVFFFFFLQSVLFRFDELFNLIDIDAIIVIVIDATTVTDIAGKPHHNIITSFLILHHYGDSDSYRDRRRRSRSPRDRRSRSPERRRSSSRGIIAFEKVVLIFGLFCHYYCCCCFVIGIDRHRSSSHHRESSSKRGLFDCLYLLFSLV